MTLHIDIEALIGAAPLTVPKAGFSHEKPITGATVEWYSPPWVFEEIGLAFDLDPCAPTGGLPWIPAKQFYSLPDDGLALPWPAGGRIWCNPPYGPATKKWLARLGQHGRGIAFVFARTDTDWFHDTAGSADAILFLNQRVKFVDHTGKPPLVLNKKTGKMQESSPGAGSMLVAWGADCSEALRRMGATRGLFVDLAALRKLSISIEAVLECQALESIIG